MESNHIIIGKNVNLETDHINDDMIIVGKNALFILKHSFELRLNSTGK